MAKAADMGELVNVEAVEICQTGIEYPLASGPRTFTTEDLADAVEAQDDPAIKQPRLRLGHEGLNDPEWDGEPAVGIIDNLRLAQEGHLILGDYVGVPEWLAAALPSAYPGRSIDGQCDVVTNTGHSWRLVITDLALLGVRWPGVTTLEDIKALYSKNGPDNVTIYTTDPEEVAAGMPSVQARTDVDDVRRQYYQSLDSSQYWWWVRSQYYDPDELIVEDEESGELYRVPFSTDADGEVTFADAVAVRIEYEDKPVKEQPEEAKAAITALASLVRRKPGVVFASRDESRKDMPVATPVKGSIDSAALRTALGLGEDATDDEVSAALAGAGIIAPPGQEGGSSAPGAEQTGTNTSSTQVPGDDPDNQAPGNSGNDPATGQPTVAPVAAGAVLVDASRLEDLERRAQRGDVARTVQETADRDATITAAIKAGKVPNSRRDHWQQSWERDPEGTKHLLTAAVDKGGLAPGLIPVTEVGSSPPDEALDDQTAYPSDWLPDVAARQAAIAAGQQQPPRQGALLNGRGMM
jgi:hypothetical protein